MSIAEPLLDGCPLGEHGYGLVSGSLEQESGSFGLLERPWLVVCRGDVLKNEDL